MKIIFICNTTLLICMDEVCLKKNIAVEPWSWFVCWWNNELSYVKEKVGLGLKMYQIHKRQHKVFVVTEFLGRGFTVFNFLRKLLACQLYCLYYFTITLLLMVFSASNSTFSMVNVKKKQKPGWRRI